MNTPTRTIAAAATITLAACLSVPLALLLAAVCFGLRKRDPWMLGDDAELPIHK